MYALGSWRTLASLGGGDEGSDCEPPGRKGPVQQLIQLRQVDTFTFRDTMNLHRLFAYKQQSKE